MRAQGFTLVELVTVIVLIAVLSVVAIARLEIGTTSAHEAAGELVSALRHAQHLSLTHTDAAGYRVEVDGTGFRVRDGAGNDVRNPLTGTAPFTEGWSDVTLAPTGTVRFDQRGVPTCSGGLGCTAANAVLTVAVPGGSESVTVERVTGYVR
ncbi:MAG: type II secretion system protein [Gammaproteobacteria bacterium]|nr:type II secretion system protein [Gammaproteobacteria bacterium]